MRFSAIALLVVSALVQWLAPAVSGQLQIPARLFETNRKGKGVAKRSIDTLLKGKVFPNDKGFMLRLSKATTFYGTRGTPHNLYGITREDFGALKRGRPQKVKRYLRRVKRLTGIDFTQAKYSDLKQPIFATIAAMLKVYSFRKRIPPGEVKQSFHYKRFWNGIDGDHDVHNFRFDRDRFTRPGSKGDKTVRFTIRIIKETNLFPNDFNFMRRVAIVETNNGKIAPKPGPCPGGIWEVDEAKFNEIKLQSETNSKLKRAIRRIKRTLNIDWNLVTCKDLDKPIYSALALNLFVMTLGRKIPNTRYRQSYFWKRYYDQDNRRRKDYYDAGFSGRGDPHICTNMEGDDKQVCFEICGDDGDVFTFLNNTVLDFDLKLKMLGKSCKNGEHQFIQAVMFRQGENEVEVNPDGVESSAGVAAPWDEIRNFTVGSVIPLQVGVTNESITVNYDAKLFMTVTKHGSPPHINFHFHYGETLGEDQGLLGALHKMARIVADDDGSNAQLVIGSQTYKLAKKHGDLVMEGHPHDDSNALSELVKRFKLP